jgi:hypothetical protein
MSRSDQKKETSADGAGRPAGIEDSALRAAGLAVAWIGGVVSGWRAFHQSNLFEAVSRGAATWLALIVLWLMALAFCQRCVLRPPASQGNSGGAEPAAGQVAGQGEA